MFANALFVRIQGTWLIDRSRPPTPPMPCLHARYGVNYLEVSGQVEILDSFGEKHLAVRRKANFEERPT